MVNLPTHQYELESYPFHIMHISSQFSKYHSPVYYQSVQPNPSTHLVMPMYVVGYVIVGLIVNVLIHLLLLIEIFAIFDLLLPVFE